MPVTVAAFVASALSAVGVGAYTAAFIGNAIIAGGWVGIASALSLAASLFLGGSPSLPKPSDGKMAKRQPVPPRVSGYGRARGGGYYMLFEEMSGHSYDVLAVHDGLIDGFEAFYLNEDLVTMSGDYVVAGTDGRYGESRISIETRQGLATETAYGTITSDLGDIWTEDHRGDGIASLAMICRKVSAEDYLKIYPNQLPIPSAVMRLQRVWDPRDEDQDYDDPDTWEWSDNPVLHLLDYLTNGNGMGQDIEARIIPEVASWIAAANVCDEDVDLNGGGTEKRYTAGGFYQHDNDPADVISTILATFDGWMGETGTGALTVYAGRFTAPSITVPVKHITAFRVQRFTADEEAVNEIVFSYTSPDHKWNEVQGQAWRDEADISARGKIRSRNVDLGWVRSHSQCRRLAKREMHKANSPARGEIVTDLYGLLLLGQRYINLSIPELSSLGTFAVQLSNAKINLENRSLSFEWVLVTAAIDEWDETTEEGEPPPDLDDVESEGVESAITASPTNLNAANGTGSAVITWRNPSSFNFNYAKVFRAGAAQNFVDAVDISGPIPGGLGQEMEYTDTHTPGTYRYWVVAYTIYDVPSIETGPDTAVIS